MLQPKKTKFKKYRKGRIHGCENRVIYLQYGKYGIVALENGRITSSQIESSRIAIKRKIKNVGKIWLRIYPDIPVTAKPAEVRMGKGKGGVSYWMARVKENRVLFEFTGPSLALAKKIHHNVTSKLPVKTKLITYD